MCSIDVLPSKTMYEIELSNIKEGKNVNICNRGLPPHSRLKSFLLHYPSQVAKKCFPLRYVVIGTSRWLLLFHIHSFRDQRSASTLYSKELIDNFGSDEQVAEYFRGLWVNLDVKGAKEKEGRKADSPFLRKVFIWLGFMPVSYRIEL